MSRRARAAFLITILFLVVTTSARAQEPRVTKGFAVNRFEPSERASDWFTTESLDLRDTRVAVGAIGDYAHKPVVIYNGDGTERGALIEHQTFIHLGLNVIIAGRVRLATSMPVLAYQTGSDVSLNGSRYIAPIESAAGDLRFGTDVRLYGEYGSKFTAALGALIWFPTGSQENYGGDGSVRVGPRGVVAGDVGPFAYSARLGYVYRAHGGTLADYPVGSEFTFGAGAGFRVSDKDVLLGTELFGSTVVDGEGRKGGTTTPVGLLFGVHYKLGPLRFSIGAGPGLSRGVGEPDARVVAGFEGIPSIEEPAKPKPKPKPKPEPEPEPEPEPVKPPPPPPAPPPPDRDKDGVLDADDACPDDAGQADPDPKKNGCPDRDKDGILDKEDACPDQPGKPDPDPKKNGCPLAQIIGGQIRIVEQVKFKTGSAVILPESDTILSAVLKVMTDHPEITQVSIEGHTDNRGDRNMNVKLSNDRAASVVKWLADHGVARSRLGSKGFGPDRPIDVNTTDEGRQNNRRVEFRITGGTPNPETPPPPTK